MLPHNNSVTWGRLKGSVLHWQPLGTLWDGDSGKLASHNVVTSLQVVYPEVGLSGSYWGLGNLLISHGILCPPVSWAPGKMHAPVAHNAPERGHHCMSAAPRWCPPKVMSSQCDVTCNTLVPLVTEGLEHCVRHLAMMMSLWVDVIAMHAHLPHPSRTRFPAPPNACQVRPGNPTRKWHHGIINTLQIHDISMVKAMVNS